MRPMAVAMPVATTMPRARAVGHGRAAEDHVELVGGRPRGDLREGPGDLGHGLRLTRQGRPR